MAKYFSVKETAQLIRAELKKEFPHFKGFSVRVGDYGNIHVRWTDGPGSFFVKPLVKFFEGYEYDGYHDAGNDKTTFYNAEEVQFGARYVVCGRRYTRSFLSNVMDQFCFKFQIASLPITGDKPESAWIDFHGVSHWTQEALEMLLAQTDAKDQFNVFGAQEDREAKHRAEFEAEQDELNRAREREERKRRAKEEESRSNFNTNYARQQPFPRQAYSSDIQWQRSILASRQSACNYLRLPTTATRDEVYAVFRKMVTESSNGAGGYRGDMGFLVQVRDKALS